ncbi:HAD domain-containing protein [Parapedobacter indicus]
MVPANSWRRPEILDDGFPAFSPNATKALQRIIDSTGARIVLTTSHK